MHDLMTRRFTSAALCLALTLTATCMMSSAQSPPPGGNDPRDQPKPAQPAPADDQVLAGPKVEDDAQKQPAGPMGPQGQERRRAQDVRMPQWMDVVLKLELSDEQREKIQAISAEFQQATREYQQSAGEDMRDVMRQVREARRAGKQPPAEAREKVRAFEEKRPKPAPYQERIWDELTDAQQATAKAQLDELRAQLAAQGENRRGPGRETGRGQGEPAEQAGEAKDPMDDMYQPRRARRAPSTPPTPPTKPETSKPAPRETESDDDAMNEPAQPGEPAPPANPRRNARRGGAVSLDDMGRKRLEFLLARQSTDRPGAPPSDQEKTFEFDDDPADEPDAGPGQD